MVKKTESDLMKDINEMMEKAKSVFPDLDYLDELPDPPKQQETPFPYGSDKARPYGWFCKTN